ncbi:DUF2835 family protein [Thioalkalivibrio sp.]|uniref:DUF2835 family protein n=1 Tax=Thioalkalivibrio sp. TaxID=2093813 RepID=UPI0012D60954|nr:DUF2835 family protein [Thioalkalivibrio sp.]TVP82107.1 MAG: DUF2835 family protein [Thioalkalivibrio sp.]
MKEFRLRLLISSQEMLTYYTGDARYLVATASDGTRVQMPARFLRPHVTSQGVVGEFLLRCDDRNRFVSLERVRG